MLQFTLTPDGKRTFTAGTRAAVGKKLATLIDGTVMSAPVVNGAITGGRFSLDLPSRPAAEALLAKLACVE